jgi:hypothetical protein
MPRRDRRVVTVRAEGSGGQYGEVRDSASVQKPKTPLGKNQRPLARTPTSSARGRMQIESTRRFASFASRAFFRRPALADAFPRAFPSPHLRSGSRTSTASWSRTSRSARSRRR